METDQKYLCVSTPLALQKLAGGAEKSIGTITSQKDKCYVGAVDKKFSLSGVAPTGCASI